MSEIDEEKIRKEDIEFIILFAMIIGGIIGMFFIFPIIIGFVAFLAFFWYITVPVIAVLVFGYYYYEHKKGRQFNYHFHFNRDSLKYILFIVALFIVVPILFYYLGIAIDIWFDYTPAWIRFGGG